jgi:hypothetical protein
MNVTELETEVRKVFPTLTWKTEDLYPNTNHANKFLRSSYRILDAIYIEVNATAYSDGSWYYGANVYMELSPNRRIFRWNKGNKKLGDVLKKLKEYSDNHLTPIARALSPLA